MAWARAREQDLLEIGAEELQLVGLVENDPLELLYRSHWHLGLLNGLVDELQALLVSILTDHGGIGWELESLLSGFHSSSQNILVATLLAQVQLLIADSIDCLGKVVLNLPHLLIVRVQRQLRLKALRDRSCILSARGRAAALLRLLHMSIYFGEIGAHSSLLHFLVYGSVNVPL